jgi:flagellar assembly protein FliH
MRRLTSDNLVSAAAPARLSSALTAETTTATPHIDPAAVQRAQVDAALAVAREQGFAAGMKDAERTVDGQVETIAARLQATHDKAVAELRAEHARLLALLGGVDAAVAQHVADAEAMAVEVAYAAVVRLLGDKVADRSLMQELCRAAVHDYGHPSATLRLSEADFASLADADVGVPVEADRRLRPGQCVVVTARGQFESGLDVRLEQMRRVLLDTLAGHREAM